MPGSWRSRQQNQVARLAAEAGFPHWYQQVNRNLGQFALSTVTGF